MLLDKYRVYRSTNLEEIRRLTSAKIRDHRIEAVNANERVQATHNVAELDGLSIHVIQYAMSSLIQCEPLSRFYLVVLPVNGNVRMVAGDYDHVCDARSGAVIPNDLRFVLHWEAGATAVVLQIEKQRLEQKLETYLGFAVKRRVRFDQWIDTETGAGAFLRATLLMVIDQLDRNPWHEINPLLSNEFAEALMATLLRSSFHNYRHLVGGISHGPLPPAIKSAMAFIRENLKEDMQINDLADAVGISPRAIQTMFKKYFRMTPVHYIRAMRLAEIRRELLDMKKSDRRSLTELAQKWGFNHLGRFSAYYRKAYHENPSQTL